MIIMPSDSVKLCYNLLTRTAGPLRMLLNKHPDDKGALEDVIDALCELKAMLMASSAATKLTLQFFPKEICDALEAFDRKAG